MDVSKIVDIIVYVIPGFILLATYSFLVPSKKGSDFARFVASIIFSLPVFGLVSLLEILVGWEIVSNRYLYIVFSWPLAVIIGWVLATLQSKVFAPLMAIAGVEYSEDPRTWNSFFSAFSDSDDFLRVFLTDGTILIGYPEYYSIDPNDDIQEVILSPCYVVDEKFKIIRIMDGDTYLNNDKIVYIENIGQIDVSEEPEPTDESS